MKASAPHLQDTAILLNLNPQDRHLASFPSV